PAFSHYNLELQPTRPLSAITQATARQTSRFSGPQMDSGSFFVVKIFHTIHLSLVWLVIFPPRAITTEIAGTIPRSFGRVNLPGTSIVRPRVFRSHPLGFQRTSRYPTPQFADQLI